MYTIVGFIFVVSGMALLVALLLAMLINHLVGLVNNEKRGLLGCKMLRKYGFTMSGSDIAPLSLGFTVFLFLVGPFWPLAIFVSFVALGAFALHTQKKDKICR